jgi:hypothetical protein
MAAPITGYLIAGHAAFEMRRRGIAESVVRSVLAAPEQLHEVRAGRDVLQSRVPSAGKTPPPSLPRKRAQAGEG